MRKIFINFFIRQCIKRREKPSSEPVKATVNESAVEAGSDDSLRSQEEAEHILGFSSSAQCGDSREGG